MSSFSKISRLSWHFIVLSFFLAIQCVHSDLLPLPTDLPVFTDPGLVKFYFYPKSGGKKEIKLGQPGSLDSAGVVPGIETVFLINGWLQDSNSEMDVVMSGTYSSVAKPLNVIDVDWGDLSGARLENNLTEPIIIVTYPIIIANVPLVGARIATFIKFLKDNKGIDPATKVHIVGHSLGSHVAGSAGSSYQARWNQNISRITGLDPAGPLYDQTISLISKNVATFVDIYYTNMGGYGTAKTDVGHLNVFVNDGTNQPGCEAPTTETQVLCNHHYSYRLFNQTIKSTSFRAGPCSVQGTDTSATCVCRSDCPDLKSMLNSGGGIVIGESVEYGSAGTYQIYEDRTFQ